MTDSLSLVNERFSNGVKADALAILADILGDEQAKQAASRIALALVTLGKANAQVFECTAASVAEAIAACVTSNLMIGGAMPTCYVVPRRRGDVTELNWQIGFRGMLTLSQRAGFQVQAFPIYPERGSPLDADGRLVIPTVRPAPVVRTVENMIGVYVHVRRLSDGIVFSESFVEADLIEARRNVSDAYQRGVRSGKPSIWTTWSEEMALKTAIRYAISRGAVPLDDVAQRVLEYDGKRDNVIEAEAVSVGRVETLTPRATGRAALGMDTREPAPDFSAETARLDRREAIPVNGQGEVTRDAPATRQEAAPAREVPATGSGAGVNTATGSDALAKPKLPKAHDPAEVVARLATLGVTLELAEAHVATPRAAWTAADVAKLVALGVDVKAGRVKVQNLTAANDGGGDADEDGAP